MLGGAPEAYEVSSKTPRVEFQSFAKFLPEAFPIKASEHTTTIRVGNVGQEVADSFGATL